MLLSSVMAEASAPASSANLGPGYDCLALALEVRCTVVATPAPRWESVHDTTVVPGEDAVLAAAQAAVGVDRPLRLETISGVPIGKGLGSSAAALVASAAAALRAFGEDARPDRVFGIASRLEGHPDNVAAAVYGGLILIPPEGSPLRIPLHPGLQPVVGVPSGVLATEQARRVIPTSFDTPTVVRSLGRVAALVAGLISGDETVLRSAHGDEIHEAPRGEIDPAVPAGIAVARGAGAVHAYRSGAGPAVVALTGPDHIEAVSTALAAAGYQVLQPSIATTGLI